MNTISARTLRNALRAGLLAAHKTADRPHLCCVAIEATGSELRVSSTDGHRVHLVQLQYSGPEFPLVQIQRNSVKAAIRELPGSAKHDYCCTLQWDGECVVVVGGETPVLLHALRDVAPFPPYQKVLPAASRWTAPYAGIGLNPRYLADACTAVGYLGGEGIRLYGTGSSELEPVIVHYERPSAGIEFTAVVMPMRL